MKLSELTIGTDYAVVPSWGYASKNARDVSTVRQGDVVKATLLELTKYEYEPANRKASRTDFTKADSGNRSVGVLVSATDSNGVTVYWTSRLADIIAPYGVLEPRWTQQAKEEADRNRAQDELRNKAQAHKQKVYAEVERSRNSVQATAKELLGANASTTVDTEGYDLDLKAVVKITLAEFEQLIELAYAGKEVYA